MQSYDKCPYETVDIFMKQLIFFEILTGKWGATKKLQIVRYVGNELYTLQLCVNSTTTVLI